MLAHWRPEFSAFHCARSVLDYPGFGTVGGDGLEPPTLSV
jgi:hypothetical protein